MEFEVDQEHSGLRLDAFLAEKTQGYSRSEIQRQIKSGNVLLNTKPAKASQIIHSGEQIRAEFSQPDPVGAPRPEPIPLDILHADEDIVVVNKPPDLVVHPGAGNSNGTLVNALLHQFGKLAESDDVMRPGIVHRLDKDTSGCIVVARSESALTSLSAQFADRTTRKLYLALTSHTPNPPDGDIDLPLERHPTQRTKIAIAAEGHGRPAHTSYELIQEYGGFALVLCHLHTGRTHQIRVHMKAIHSALCGDRVYNPKLASRHPRQMLHAWKLEFNHPKNNRRIAFTSPLPDDFIRTGVLEEHLPIED